MTETFLSVKWSVSRERDTYGYNICTLTDESTGKRYRCNGGGYDMTGTVFGEWMADVHQDKLVTIAGQAAQRRYRAIAGGLWERETREPHYDYLYGMSEVDEPSTIAEDAARGFRRISVTVDGACGIESMRKIAEAAGIATRWLGTRKGATIGYIATWDDDAS